VVMMLMCHNKKIMGQFTRISRMLRIMGWLATAVMAAAAAGMFMTWNH
jgi:Mn2+/Fe2+ NRAMP family transporter